MVHAKGARAYVVTADDVLWLSRAVEAEGPPTKLVARALVNLFAWFRARHPGSAYAASLAALVRGYAQPVSPKWENEGTAAQRERRREARERVAFSDSTVEAVREALGQGWALDWTDYAAPTLDASSKGYQPRTEAVRGKNRFWTRAPGWTGYAVTGDGMSRVQEIRELAQLLPKNEQRQVEQALVRLGNTVGAQGQAPVEWDLQFANTLDALYQAVSDRVTELGKSTEHVVKTVVDEVVEPATGLLFALALLGLVILMYQQRRR
jgi:hypothetical protein